MLPLPMPAAAAEEEQEEQEGQEGSKPGVIVCVEIDGASVCATAFYEDGIQAAASSCTEVGLFTDCHDEGGGNEDEDEDRDVEAWTEAFVALLGRLCSTEAVQRGQITAFAISTKRAAPIFVRVSSAECECEGKHDRSEITGRVATAKTTAKAMTTTRMAEGGRTATGSFASAIEQRWTPSLACAITTPASLLTSLLTGRTHASIDADEAAATGLFDAVEGTWDRAALDGVSRGEGGRLASMLGSVTQYEEATHGCTVCSAWLEHRLPALSIRDTLGGGCRVLPVLDASVAVYLSFCPHPLDVVLDLGPDDTVLVPVCGRALDACFDGTLSPPTLLLPNPLARLATTSSSLLAPRPWLAVSTLRSAGEARRIVRDSHANAKWTVFDRLLAAVPFGGSAGMDNKLFSVVVPGAARQPPSQQQQQQQQQQQGDSTSSHAASPAPSVEMLKFEKGIRVTDFGNPSANPRCLVEGQAMALRALLSRCLANSLAGPATANGDTSQTSLMSSLQQSPDAIDREVLAPRLRKHAGQRGAGYWGAAGSLAFDPYDRRTKPARVLARGKAACNAAIADVYSAILGADVYVVGAPIRPQHGLHHRQEETGKVDCRPPSPSSEARGALFYALACMYAREGETFDGVVKRFLDRERRDSTRNEAYKQDQSQQQEERGWDGIDEEEGSTPRACLLNLAVRDGRPDRAAAADDDDHEDDNRSEMHGGTGSSSSHIRCSRPRSSTLPTTAMLSSRHREATSTNGLLLLDGEALAVDQRAAAAAAAAAAATQRARLPSRGRARGRVVSMSASLADGQRRGEPWCGSRWSSSSSSSSSGSGSGSRSRASDGGKSSASRSSLECTLQQQQHRQVTVRQRATTTTTTTTMTRTTSQETGAERDRLTRVAKSDDDVWLIYGSLTEEYVRLASMSLL